MRLAFSDTPHLRGDGPKASVLELGHGLETIRCRPAACRGIVAPDIEPAPTFTFTCGKPSAKADASPFRFTTAEGGR